jgi:hypothetical protein
MGATTSAEGISLSLSDNAIPLLPQSRNRRRQVPSAFLTYNR